MLTVYLYLVALFVTSAYAKTPYPKGITVYWGQDSGGSQQTLRRTCDRDAVDTVILSFLTRFPEMELKIRKHCWQTFSSGLLHCPEIGVDITYCQREKNKKVILSMGGSLGPYGFNSDEEAKAFAKVVFDTFGPGDASERPFDKAVVDGYDFTLHYGKTGYVAFANQLNRLHADVKYDYYLTVSPQCYYPDATVGDVLNQAHVDAINIVFSDYSCNFKGDGFNYMTD